MERLEHRRRRNVGFVVGDATIRCGRMLRVIILLIGRLVAIAVAGVTIDVVRNAEITVAIGALQETAGEVKADATVIIGVPQTLVHPLLVVNLVCWTP